jgi:EmrB/QacA subfamily drug resistance transporter
MDVKQGALVAAILGSTVVSVDATVVNVALPAIGDDLGGGLSGQQWVANAYLLTLAALILVSGSLADLFGERRVFSLGVALFGVTSVLCAIAPTIEVLVIARALQGVAGALLTPAALAILIAVFPPEERGKAIGTWTAWGGIGILLGPLLGGQIVDSASWRIVFAINVPIVLGTLALASRYVPEGHRQAGGAHPRIDVRGAVLCALGLAGPTFALIQQPESGWGSPLVLVPLVGGLALFAAFLRHEARTREPMLPLGLFARPNFRWGNVETVAMYGGLAIFGFFVGLFLQQVSGWSALQAGTIGLVPTGVMFLLSRRFGALADRFGPRLFMGLGPFLVALGFLGMLRLDTEVSFVADLLPALMLFSLGLAITVSPLTAAVLADADESNAGIASAVNNAVARTAGLLAHRRGRRRAGRRVHEQRRRRARRAAPLGARRRARGRVEGPRARRPRRGRAGACGARGGRRGHPGGGDRRVPPGHGDRRGAAGRGRPGRAARDPQPPRRHHPLRGLPGRPAHRGAGGGRARARAPSPSPPPPDHTRSHTDAPRRAKVRGCADSGGCLREWCSWRERPCPEPSRR